MSPRGLFTTGILLSSALALIPFLFLGHQTPFIINDILDSNHVLYAMIGGQIEGMQLQDGIYPGLMNGLPESALPSRFSMIAWIYTMFEPFTAYVVNLWIIRVTAFAGMFLLLQRMFGSGKPGMAFFAALAFSFIPFFPFGGLSVAGLPLLAWAIAELTVDLRDLKAWLIILVFPFYSNLVWVGIIYLLVLGSVQIYFFVREKRTLWGIWLSMCMLSLGYILSEYRVIHDTLLFPQYTSHRVEFSMAEFLENVTLPWAVWTGWMQFINGQEHALSAHFPIIPLVVLIALLAWVFVKTKWQSQLFQLFLLTGLLSLLYGIFNWTPVAALVERSSLLRLIDLSRVYFLQPALWYIMFGLSLIILAGINRYTRWLSYALILAQFAWLFRSDPGWSGMFSAEIPKNQERYEDFYRPAAFSNVKRFMGSEFQHARFACLGIYPGIAQMNGFKTIDGYVSNYPLDYKHAFRKIIAAELEKDPFLRRYFDHWGSRCYLFSHETGTDFMVKESEGRSYETLSLDRVALTDLNCNYLLSALPIRDAVGKGFHFLGMQQNPQSGYKIYLYRVSQYFQG